MIGGAVLFVLLAVLERANIIAATNVARGGIAVQSSVVADSVPERAIDGNHAANWYEGSCTHTKGDMGPWWRVDLLKTHTVKKVVITNRRDGPFRRINGAEIRIGDSLNDDGNANPRCAVVSTIKRGASQNFLCHGMEGRYVNIVIPGRQEYLSLCEVEVYGLPSDGTVPAANIARGGIVVQSSVYDFGVPDKAIDGNHTNDWGLGSCSHTMKDYSPWWRLDLLKSHKVNKVIITNRGDAMPERINGSEIRIGDSLIDNGNANPRCAVVETIPEGDTQSFVCNGMEGRYINIVIPERQEYLTLCEVEVYGVPSDGTFPAAINVARGGTVQQSSVFDFGVPKNAIDGNHASDWERGSCSHTLRDLKPWWRLDLLRTYKVHKIVITNRGDADSERINGAEIRIGDSIVDSGNANPRCAVISTIPAGGSKPFLCNAMEGRYINIVIPGRRENLTLCEVEVYGIPSDGTSPVANVARGGKAVQSSVYWGGVPERAIDGNDASGWTDLSCSCTTNELKPWWRLDLLKTHKVHKVIITNRENEASNRISGAEIHIGDSLDDNGNANPRCAVILGIPSGASQTFFCDEMEGRFVNIVIPGREVRLSLCEVEVYGVPSVGTSPFANIARRGRVVQSSVFEGGIPEKAIDGNRTNDCGSCAHTLNDLKPWWRLDLLMTYKINKVIITNRGDAASDLINGAEIRIGHSLSDDGNVNPRCTVIRAIPAGVSQTFFCNEMEGRYINIVIPGRRENLTLCEVEVYGESSVVTSPPANIARGGTAVQSSVFEGGVPERAIDGNRANDWEHGSCSRTLNDSVPWWRLDLLKSHQVNEVIITNGGDAASEQINGAEILVGDSLDDNGNANPRCRVITANPAGVSQSFYCNEMVGRYINIVIRERHENLTLCEVEVYGVLLDDTVPAVNVARAVIATQSSVFENGIPQRAIDGYRANKWDQGSCTHTLNDTKPWWRLDLLKPHKVYKVAITNRGDAFSERINGAEIRIGDSLRDNGNANPRCTVIASIPAGDTFTFVCNKMEGQFINIVIPGRQEYLTLCEVEVYGVPLNGTSRIANFARRATAVQSSVFQFGNPRNAIDLNHDNNWDQASCSHTEYDMDPWWRLDLYTTKRIHTVIITNRRDCCAERINGAEIRIGDSLSDDGNENPICSVIAGISAGASQAFNCDGMEGRHVNIVIPGRAEYLTLCEVEVYGEEIPKV